MLGLDPKAPEEVQGLTGFIPAELGLCQSLDADLAFIFAWLEGEEEPEEGELFLANPTVRTYHINRNLFLLDDHKNLWRESEEEGEKRLLEVPGSSSRMSLGFATTSRQRDTRGRQDQGQTEGPLLLVRDVEGRWELRLHMRSLQQELVPSTSCQDRNALVPCGGSYAVGAPRFSVTLAPCGNKYVLVMAD